MASLRKRYQTHVASPADKDEPPVMTAPTAAAKLPDPVADAKPPESIETESPAEKAAQSALKARLAEMERAEGLQRQQQRPPQHVAEPPQAPQEPEDPLAHLPPRVQRWYREHPELATDPERAAQVQYCHHVARREVGQEFTDPYFDRMEAMLFGPATNGRAESKPTPQAANYAPARNSAPQRQPARMSVAVSAPPSREAPSMTTGRPQGGPVRLTNEQIDAARFSGVSPEEYARQLERMNRMKSRGEMQ